MTATLLIEIGVEELPPKAMRPLADAFANGLAQALADAGLAHGTVTRYATPRRLAVSIAETESETESRTVEKAGPTLAIAFDDHGKPTRAGEGFARSVGVDLSALEHEDSDKGERLVYRAQEPGRPLSALLQAAVDSTLQKLPIPKRMRWGDFDHSFVRPVHWVVALHGRTVVPLEVFGITAGSSTPGHRFHHPQAIKLASATDYAKVLERDGHVVTDPDARAERILEQIGGVAAELGGQALIDDALVEEVTALVEWPVAIAGRFESRFLVLPREVLIATLQEHQRYFPVEDDTGELVAGFVTVANIDSLDMSQVIAGNERVIRPRLADALFFWNQDRRTGLDGYVGGLSRVSFQRSLGSLADKCGRVRSIAAWLAAAVDANPKTVDRAAVLAKTDLLTEMVGEFPELQGIMGRYYAREGGETAAVAQAIGEQYAPNAAGAPIARSAGGQILSMADRMDTLAGIFSIGKRPTGDKDPFALRRAALGILRTIIEAGLNLDLLELIEHAIAQQPVTSNADTVQELWLFHVERLRGYYNDRALPSGVFEAVAALEISDIADFDHRVQALSAFAPQPEAIIVGAAHKRIRNILQRNASEEAASELNRNLITEPAEAQLAAACRRKQEKTRTAVDRADYRQALTELTELAEPLDAFFDQVMVMSDDPAQRQNRLALLRELDALCRQVADLSCLSLASTQ